MPATRIESQNAAAFLASLDVSGDLWAPFETGRWVFRGHANAAWALTPTALRQNQRLSFKDPTVRGPLDNNAQIQAEEELLSEFVAFSDELAFSLPGDLSSFLFPWAQHEAGPVVLDTPWPPVALLQLAAIAQHHGVPTRLLDFSFNPLVAAYFAACDACEQADALAIWAVDIVFVYRAWAPFQPGVRPVQVPRGPNPFLHAQSGLFLYDAEDSRTPVDDRILARDLALADHLDQSEKDSLSKSDRVRVLTLPSSEREALIALLARRRVTRAHLQPTLDNVVRELKARWSP